MTRHIFQIGQRVRIRATGDPQHDNFMLYASQTGRIISIWRVTDGGTKYDMARVKIGTAEIDVTVYDIEPA